MPAKVRGILENCLVVMRVARLLLKLLTVNTHIKVQKVLLTVLPATLLLLTSAVVSEWGEEVNN